METLGQRIKRFRKALKISQNDLGIKIGISQATVSQYEDGTINIPTNQLPLIASALNVSEAELLNNKAAAPNQALEQQKLAAISGILRLDRVEDVETILEALEALLNRGSKKNQRRTVGP